MHQVKKDNIRAFRHTRQDNHLQLLTMKIGNASVRLQNWSRIGIGFAAEMMEHQYEVGQTLKNIKILCGSLPLYDGSIQIRSKRPDTDKTNFYGATFLSSLFLIESIEATLAVENCVSDLHRSKEILESVKPEFCQSVLTLSEALRKIQQTCEQQEARLRQLNYDRRRTVEEIFLTSLAPKVRDLFVQFNTKVGTQVDVESLDEGSIYHQIFQTEIYPYFKTAEIARRAFEKPRGYAGDYEMMNQIYRSGFEGDDLFGKILHYYIANENSSNSVKYRKPYFMGHIRKTLEGKGIRKILSIASGPSVEFQEIVREWDQKDLSRIEMTLFDLDKEALEHAQSMIVKTSIETEKQPQVNYINASVKQFLMDTHESTEHRETYDLIYSGGLFDYIDNLTATALVRRFYDYLNPGGTLVIGNFTKNNTTKAFCHLLVNWTLIHKTEQEILNWAQDLEDTKKHLDFDDERINAFLVVRRNETR